jgi:hypothetical protein
MKDYLFLSFRDMSTYTVEHTTFFHVLQTLKNVKCVYKEVK